MPYIGELLNACGSLNLEFSRVAVVAVSGVSANPCGHCLLFVQSGGGIYMHVDGANDYPRYMSQAGYARYLRENKKQEWKRVHLSLPNPSGAAAAMESLLSGQWRWLLIPHNCVAFVESLIAAGGGSWSSISNCPAVAIRDESDVQRFMNGLESSIYSAYGVARP